MTPPCVILALDASIHGSLGVDSRVKPENDRNIKTPENDNKKMVKNDRNIKTPENDRNIKTSEDDAFSSHPEPPPLSS